MIGILIPEFPSQTHVFFWREICTLREMGVQVAVISTRRPGSEMCRHEFAEGATRETHYVFPPRWRTGVRILCARPLRTLQAIRYVLALGETPWKRRLVYLGLLLCAADLLEYARNFKLQHIHAHSCADAAHIVALCRILGGPSYSLTLHGDLPVYGSDHASKMAGAACLTCAGPHLKKQIVEEVGIPGARVLSNGMGVDTDKFRDLGLRDHAPGKLHLVTVARLNLCKGHRYALAAMRAAIDRGCDLRYTVAGDGPDRALIEEEVRRLGLTDRVTITGTMSEGEVLALLQHADVFVLPSVGAGEAWPVSLMEAMSCGLPSVCSIIGSTPEMVLDGVDGRLVPQEDVAALEEAFVRLAEDVPERRRLGEAARRRAVEQFDCKLTTRRFVEFIARHTDVRLPSAELHR